MRSSILKYDPLRAGLAFLPMTGMIIAGAGLAQVLVRVLGVRGLAMLGMSLGAVGLLLFTGLPVDGTYAGNLLPGLLTMSLGMGLTFVPVTLMATTRIEARDAGLASGLLNTAQQIGGALGLAILSTLAANITSGSLASVGSDASPAVRAAALLDGFHGAFLGAAALFVVGLVLLATLIRREHVASIEAVPEAEEAIAA